MICRWADTVVEKCDDLHRMCGIAPGNARLMNTCLGRMHCVASYMSLETYYTWDLMSLAFFFIYEPRSRVVVYAWPCRALKPSCCTVWEVMAKKRKIESSSAVMRRNVAIVMNETPTHSKTTSKLAVWMVRFFLSCVYTCFCQIWCFFVCDALNNLDAYGS